MRAWTKEDSQADTDLLPRYMAPRERADDGRSVREAARILAVVSFYFAVSLTLTFLNKHLMAQAEFQEPLFLTWFQFATSIVLLSVLGRLGKGTRMFGEVATFRFDSDVARAIAPLTLVYLTMVTLSNVCLSYVEASFYQVARSLTIPFSILFSRLFLQQQTSAPAATACAVIVCGFFIGSYGEVRFSWPGAVAGAIASAANAVYSVQIKRKLAIVANSHWRLLYYNNILSTLLLLPVLLVNGSLHRFTTRSWIDFPSYFYLLSLTGLLGFLINLAVFLTVKFTSPLTNSVSGTAKACVQTLLAMWLFRNPVSRTNLLGIALTISGSAWYSRVRYAEMQAADSAGSAARRGKADKRRRLR